VLVLLNSYELMRYLDKNKTGYVNLKEFVSRLQVRPFDFNGG